MSNFDVRHAVLFSGSDIGQQINNALADLPTAGGRIVVASGSYTFSTAIDLTTGNENVILEGDGMGNTVLTFSGGATPVLKAGDSTSNLVTIRDLTITSSNPVTGQIGIYLNGNNNNVSIERVEIKAVGDDAIRSDSVPTAMVNITACYIHANPNGYAVSITAGIENMAITGNEIYNNKGGINISGNVAAPSGISIRDNDIETGTGTGSNSMLNLVAMNAGVISSGNTYGTGTASTASDLVTVACKAFCSIGDSFSIGKTSQNCIHFTSTAVQCTIISPILNSPGVGMSAGGTAIQIDSGCSDITIINPTYYNTSPRH